MFEGHKQLLNIRIPRIKQQMVIGITMFVMAVCVAYEIGGPIAAGDMRTVEFAVIGFAGLGAAVAILRSWRTGFYFFLGWLVFEDFARKYLNNDLALFFGKDILAALTYVSLFAAIRKGREKSFRPPFLLPLAIFVWLGVVQIFNPNSPSILYGLLGFKVYFYYIPLLWVGYALVRNDEELRKFLVINVGIGTVIALIGIIQAIVGNSFLNPPVLNSNLARLGDLEKYTPLGGQVFNLPDSIFVSAGRFGAYLTVIWIVAMGAAGYLILARARRGQKIVLASVAVVAAATVLGGARGPLVYMLAFALIMIVGFFWGAQKRVPQSRLLVKAIRRSVIVGALGLAAILVLFPQEAGTRIAFYTQTLSPESSAYEANWRGFGYPLENLKLAFTVPHWELGNGIGLASLGRQYVAEILKQPVPSLWVEEGFGVLIVELGIVAPFLWLVWSGALLYYCWNVVRILRGTRFFPIAFAVTWYVFLLLIFLTWGGLSIYQNYINNAYLWILVGVLFRLPDLLHNTPSIVVPASLQTEITV
ncbi:MAG TPA: hypothetical protein VFW94_17855 [Candidatus Acidoferrales bacterium]|nr:hypothetical protein [Candidatus Acidoferrales bacterium]